MGEIAYCQPLRDPQDLINRLKSIALPYPQPLRDALIRRFQWEILFGIENAELAAARNEQTHIAGCVYRSLACVAQIVFARTSAISSTRRVRYGSSAVTADNSASGRAGTEIWRLIGNGALATACDVLRQIDRQLKALTRSSEQQP
ncbi:hypothetical protein ACFQX9_19915 [Bradyrhizobium sp. GCM10028915]|uniref:hypothetical protein n=1 Tax=Bradyrhizobium sp. GCM10028915 TaxID=3273385 RepID=UPI0036090F7D